MDGPLNLNSIYNLCDEAECDMKNYAGGCYHNTLRDLHSVITDVRSQINAALVINAAPPPPPSPRHSHHYSFKFLLDVPLWKRGREQHRSIYSVSCSIKKKVKHCILFSVRFKVRIDYEKSLFLLSLSSETPKTRKWPRLLLESRGLATWRSHARALPS